MGTFCTTTIVRKKRGENYVISCDVTFGHVTDVTSGYGVTCGNVTDVTSGYDITSGSTEQQQRQYSQSNDDESYYILKTNNPFCFCFENIYTVKYFM